MVLVLIRSERWNERERELWFRPMYWTEFCPSCYRESFACLNKVRFKQSGLGGGYGSGWIRIGCGSSHMMVLWLLSIFFIAKCEKELFANCFNQHHRMLIYVSLDSVFIYLFKSWFFRGIRAHVEFVINPPLEQALFRLGSFKFIANLLVNWSLVYTNFVWAI